MACETEKATLNQMAEEAKLLKKFLEPCRLDMHEPDEQDVSAKVVGDHLDNAMGDYINPEGKYQEFVIVLKKGKKTLNVNLANLIALARLAFEEKN